MLNEELYLRSDFKQAWQDQDPFSAADALQGTVYRELEQRRTLAFDLNAKRFFVKIHKGIAWKEIFKNLTQLRLPVVSAKNEWLAIKKLTEINIETLTAVAYAKRGCLPSTLESFLVTEDVGPNQSLEDLCMNWRDQPPQFLFKLKLIKYIADVSQRMHKHGTCHRDFYICHFLLSEGEEFKLTLIDLHRALVKNNLSQRWVIKDIGSLYFSAMKIGLTKRDLLRFIKVYSGKSLRSTLLEDKRFWGKVMQRALALKVKHE